MNKYCIVMNWDDATITVNSSYIDENDINVNYNVWGYSDKIPDFHEFVYYNDNDLRYLTLFNFSENRGITITCESEICEDIDKLVESTMKTFGFDLTTTEWYFSDEPMKFIMN